MVAPSTVYSTSVRVGMSVPLAGRARPRRPPPRPPIPRPGTAGVKASRRAGSGGVILRPDGRAGPLRCDGAPVDVRLSPAPQGRIAAPATVPVPGRAGPSDPAQPLDP